MTQIGTAEHPLRVAIVGAGPSGFYAAEHILKGEDLHAQVDLFDRLPTPFGLVRGGVAPDHPKIKSVTRVYEKTAAREGFRFFGNVKIGHDIEVEEAAQRLQLFQRGQPPTISHEICPDCSELLLAA